jgi:hypothetical protein
MKIHTTNYENAFIEVAEDCPAAGGEIPPAREDGKTIARIQYEMVSKNPYKFTSDDVLFQVFAERKELTEGELEDARKQFFSKGQACMRASPLTKRYGWGVHSDKDGKIALVPSDSAEYRKFLEDEKVPKFKAMRSSR